MPPKSKAKFHGVPGERPNQCEATAKSGARCRRSALNGSNVCVKHGSATRLSREAARARLASMVPAALGVLAAAITSKKTDGVTRRLRLTAAKDVLDRNGLKPKEEVVLLPSFDSTKFADFSDADLDLFISLARRASTMRPPNEERES